METKHSKPAQAFGRSHFRVTLELATIRQLDAHEYGQFLIMVWDVPLCIGMAWSCILYSVMEFSDASSLPYWTRPILDGLLALNIDLDLDAIAIRFWDWGRAWIFIVSVFLTPTLGAVLGGFLLLVWILSIRRPHRLDESWACSSTGLNHRAGRRSWHEYMHHLCHPDPTSHATCGMHIDPVSFCCYGYANAFLFNGCSCARLLSSHADTPLRVDRRFDFRGHIRASILIVRQSGDDRHSFLSASADLSP